MTLHWQQLPKAYKVARPTTGARPGLPPWLGWLGPAVALATAVGAAVWAPLDDADAALHRTTLGWVAPAPAGEPVILLWTSAADVTSGACGEPATATLTRAGVRAVVRICPLEELCPGPTAGAAPTAALGCDALGASSAHAVDRRSLARDAADALTLLDLPEAPVVHMPEPESTPGLALRDLLEGQVDATALQGKVALIAYDADGRRDRAQRLAAYLGAALHAPLRRAAPWWLAALWASAVTGGMVLAHRRRGLSRAALVLGGAAAMLLAGQVVAASAWETSLLPVVSLLGGTVVALAVLAAPYAASLARLLGTMRARAHAATGTDDSASEAFFRRLAELARQIHPADFVLVGELPPEQWHLHFRGEEQSGDRAIRERRRDVRRMPFCNHDGIHDVHVVRDFLIAPDAPVVVVPLTHAGEVEGFALLCGQQAERAHATDPERARRLGRRLGAMLRRRRLGRDEAPARAGDADEPPEGLREVLRRAPVGLLHADRFGHVRTVSATAATLLKAIDIRIGDGELGSTTLPLTKVIAAAGQVPYTEAARLMSELSLGDGTVEVGSTWDGVPVKLHVNAVTRQERGIESVQGYVAHLARGEGGALANLSHLAPPGMLAAFDLGDIAMDVAERTTSSTGTSIKLGELRPGSLALGQREALVGAMEQFLIDVIEAGPPRPPVLAVPEPQQRAELHVLDLWLGVPDGAVERVLRAPNVPPPGLESLAMLVDVVHASHGEVELDEFDGWSLTLVIHLPRARASRDDAHAPVSGTSNRLSSA